MIGIYLNIIISILFIVPFLKKDTKKDIFIIWGIYFASSFLAIFFDPTSFDGFKRASQYDPLTFVLYSVLICYSLTPLYTIRTKNKRPKLTYFNFSLNEKKAMWFIVFGGIFSLLYMLPYALKSIALGAKEIRMYVLVLEETTVLPISIFTTISVAFATFSSVYLALFFLAIKSNLKKSTTVLLFIISLSYIVNSLCYMARDGLLFYLIFGLIFLINFWETYSKKLKKRLILFSVVILAGFVFTLNSFTEDRFGDSDNGTMGYIASQPYVFAENIDRRSVLANEYFYGTSLRFPIFDILLRRESPIYDRDEQYEWTFGTFLTDFYNVNGFFTLFAILIIFIEFFRFQLKKSKNNQMKFLLIYTFYIHFMVSGLFYFRLGNFSGNIFMLILLILILSYKNQRVCKFQ